MSIQTYSAERIGLLKQTLINSTEANKPQDYEIRVDDMKVVPRTSDVEQFDKYEEFVTEETKRIIVLVYDGTSRRNEKFVYLLKDEKKEKPVEKGLSGTEVEKIVSEKLEQKETQWKMAQLEKENKELKEEIKQNEKDFEKIIAHNKKLESGRDFEDIQWGKILGVAGDTLIRSNTKFLAKVPGMSGLAGIIEADNRAREKQIESPQPQPEEEATFKMKKENNSEEEENDNEKNESAKKKENPNNESELSEMERDQQVFLRHLRKWFPEDQVKQIISLLNFFVDNPKAIGRILNAIEQRKSDAKTENKKAEPQPQFKKQNTAPETQQQEQSEKQEEKKPEQKTESAEESTKHEADETINKNKQLDSHEINHVDLKNELEETNLEGVENHIKENDFNELPATM